MGNLKDKKGFTLIELLAVIVILGIVTVIGATTVLPYIQNAGKDAFNDEANNVIDAASQAVSLIQINSITNNYTTITNGYCFTLKNLSDLGLWSKDPSKISATNADGKYSGTVKVTKATGSQAYQYALSMTDGTKWLATKAATGAITISESKTATVACS